MKHEALRVSKTSLECIGAVIWSSSRVQGDDMEDIFGFAPTLTGTVEFLDLSDGFLGDMQSSASEAAPSADDGGVAFMAFSAPAEEDEVVITGTRREFDPISGSPWGGVWDEPDVWTGAGEVGGGGGGEEDEPDCPNASEPTPSAADINAIRGAAREFFEQVQALNASSTVDNEYAALIYLSPDGDVKLSGLSAGGVGRVTAPIPSEVLPSGSTILGVIHNHPSGRVTPSITAEGGSDWAVYDYYRTYTNARIRADPALVMYIVAGDKVYEFTAADRETSDEAEGNDVTVGGGCA